MERMYLVRKSRNMIEGPYKKGEILDLLENGVLNGADEIAPSGSYWFSCAEGNEIEKWVGVYEQAKTIVEADELTLTMSGHVNSQGQLINELSPDDDEITDPFLNEETSEQAPPFSQPTPSSISSTSLSGANSKPEVKQTLKRVEGFRVEETAYWKWATFILIPVVLLVVYKILSIARFF